VSRECDKGDYPVVNLAIALMRLASDRTAAYRHPELAMDASAFKVNAGALKQRGKVQGLTRSVTP